MIKKIAALLFFSTAAHFCYGQESDSITDYKLLAPSSPKSISKEIFGDDLKMDNETEKILQLYKETDAYTEKLHEILGTSYDRIDSSDFRKMVFGVYMQMQISMVPDIILKKENFTSQNEPKTLTKDARIKLENNRKKFIHTPLWHLIDHNRQVQRDLLDRVKLKNLDPTISDKE